MGRLLIVILFIGVVIGGSVVLQKSRERQTALATPAPAGAAESGGHAAFFSPMSYAEAKSAAGSRLLLVDATATWCPPCKAMERDTWPQPELAAWMKDRGLAVQVDVDKDPAAAKELQIRGMPTVILMKDGRELARNMGYMDAGALLQWLNQHAG
ncbi:MAG TPA: thioredoxin family protein [Phycisphaerales bacterium]|nr:thioredoxin family protein [Phycisphaerales bacterium]